MPKYQALNRAYKMQFNDLAVSKKKRNGERISYGKLVSAY
jgi:hypothetical protein